MRETTWASRLASSIDEYTHESSRYRHGIIHSIREVDDDTIEIIFSTAASDQLKGIRLNQTTLREADEPFPDLTMKELGFYIVEIGVEEGRSLDEYLPADGDGIMWLPADRWLRYD